MSTSESATKADQALSLVDLSQNHKFIKPVKRIHDGHDVSTFLSSHAYTDIGLFISQLNRAMCPRIVQADGARKTKAWNLGSEDVVLSAPIKAVQNLLHKIDAIIEEAPPDTGPRRFGNVSFRKWYEILESRVSGLLEECLPSNILRPSTEGIAAKEELTAYLLGAFGSAQRLDYGTGHELSFLAFLGCIWKLGGFQESKSGMEGSVERSIVLGIIEPYLRVVRHLISTYTLEPAGSHGVWGLDDHFFLSYIFGSAQLCAPIKDGDAMPVEGSLPEAPDPGDVAKKPVVDRERSANMYFSAVGFINDVKTGPFWEHSPILFDISGVRAGWGKINKGMIKMYNAEVLSKFPVVQHFPFGSLFSWEKDPNAPVPSSTTHTQSQPSSQAASIPGNMHSMPNSQPLQQEVTQAPWATEHKFSIPSHGHSSVRAPRAGQVRGNIPTAAPWATSSTSAAPGMMPATAAPWAQPPQQPRDPTGGLPETRAPWATDQSSVDDTTRAPWANLPNRGAQSKK